MLHVPLTLCAAAGQINTEREKERERGERAKTKKKPERSVVRGSVDKKISSEESRGQISHFISSIDTDAHTKDTH